MYTYVVLFSGDSIDQIPIVPEVKCTCASPNRNLHGKLLVTKLSLLSETREAESTHINHELNTMPLGL